MVKISTLKHFLLFASALFFSAAAFAQLTVNSAPTPTFLVDNVLLGTGVTASGVTYSGPPNGRGEFGGVSNIGFASGVMLATGDISAAVGPNSSGSMTLGGTGIISTDPQLSAIASSTLFDAAILEFDFIPMADTLKFRYVFASEEYPEYVCSNFNDVFGFFISGPNPAGGTYANQNIATIPGSVPALAVAINTVNPGVAGSAGTPGGCTSLAYATMYFNNSTPPGATVQYDGFTIPLTAIAPVICGQTYHIKIAVSDVGDGSFDSGVFLEAGSFSSQGVQIFPEISYGGSNDSTLYEGCGQACVYFVRTSNLSASDTIDVTVTGTASNGVDYNAGLPGLPLPTQLIFDPGIDSVQFCITAVPDGITEGPETIHLMVVQDNGCSNDTTSATIYLDEFDSLSVVTTGDTSFCASGTATLSALVTGGVEPYTYTWSDGAASTSSPTVSPGTTTNYYVTVSDACTNSTDPTPNVTDSVLVTVFPAPVMTINPVIIAPNDSTLFEGCNQACIYFIRTSSLTVADTFNITIGGTGTNGTDYSTSGSALPNQIIFPVGVDSVQYCITATIDGAAEGTETILLSVIQGAICPQPASLANLYIEDVAPLSLVTTGDTTLCNLGGTVTLNTTVTGGLGAYTYSWTSSAPPVADPTVTVTSTTTFYVTVNDACNNTPDSTPPLTDSVTVNVQVFAPFTVSANDVLVCPGDVVDLNITVNGGGVPYVYFWSNLIGSDSLTSYNIQDPSLIANISGVYQVTVMDICNNTTTTTIDVVVEEDCMLNIPNIITPNGDGPALNEMFYVENLERFPSSALQIFNRWGKKIFEADSYANNWTSNKYEDGTYFYILTVPASGVILPKVKSNPSLRITESTDKVVFAGYFQIAR